jgi:hypothetical protein
MDPPFSVNPMEESCRQCVAHVCIALYPWCFRSMLRSVILDQQLEPSRCRTMFCKVPSDLTMLAAVLQHYALHKQHYKRSTAAHRQPAAIGFHGAGFTHC